MFPFTELTDNEIVLRAFHNGEEDVLHQAVHESMKELHPWMAWATEEYTLDVARKFIMLTRLNWQNGSLFAFAVAYKKSGELLGGCSLSHIHPVYHFCNLGYWVRTSRRGHGIAGRAALLATRFAVEKLKLLRVEIVIAEGNEASLRVARKLRAHEEGLLLNRMIIREKICSAHMFSLLPSDLGLATPNRI